MKPRPWFVLSIAALVMAGLAACSTQVERVGVEEVHDLSGNWNDVDSRLVAEAMIADALDQRWLRAYMRGHDRPPTVIVGEIRNLSHEHINVRTFIADMERALINSGKVEFVASAEERGEVRAERRDQDINAREDTRHPAGREIGADFMLKGQINTIFDREGRTTVKYYQVDLELISMADNRKVWIGQKKIKKVVEKPLLRF